MYILSAFFSSTEMPTRLSGKHESNLRIPTSPMFAAMVKTRVPDGKTLLTFKPFSFNVCLYFDIS